MENKISKRIETKDMILIPLFTSLIAIGAFIKIPIGVVPVTLQFVFCALAGIILGKKKGSLAFLLYLIIGLSGIPVFTVGGGPAYILKPTFGYLVGMLLAVYVIGYLSEKFSTTNIIKLFVINFIGLLIVYTVGVAYLWLIKNLYLSSPLPFQKAVMFGALVFMLGDTLWCLAAALVGSRINAITDSKYRK